MSHDESFPCMGTTMRVVVEGAGAERAGARVRELLESFDRRLSRFRPDSELTRLNQDDREVVPASPLLCALVRAGCAAASRTGGLVDPTIIGALEKTGYGASRAGAVPLPLGEALGTAPARAPAAPSSAATWRQVSVGAGVISRPPGVRLDSGGVGKGLAADLAADLLGTFERFAVDCGGDVRIGGQLIDADPFSVDVLHPLTGRRTELPRCGAGGVATSGIDRRVWRLPDGRWTHHLVDPSTGAAVWTGLVGATALAPTALEADVLAKWALLAGPGAARALLRRRGGVLFSEDGGVEVLPAPIPLSALRPFALVG